jgi:FixJ family two-component response regulator
MPCSISFFLDRRIGNYVLFDHRQQECFVLLPMMMPVMQGTKLQHQYRQAFLSGVKE